MECGRERRTESRKTDNSGNVEEKGKEEIIENEDLEEGETGRNGMGDKRKG